MKKIKPIIKIINKGDIFCNEDPMESLRAKGLIIQVGNGLFVLKGVLLDILNKIETIICEIAECVNAEHVFVPTILSYDNAIKSNYLDSFSEQALMITPLKRNDKSIGNFHTEYEGMVSPTVCYHCFSSLKNKIVRHNHAMTAISKCVRKEEGILDTLGRLTNFTMREIVFFGDKKYCFNNLNKVMEETIKILELEFNLSFRVVTASDPFFGENSEMKKDAQLMSESKYEIQALLPFNNTSISIGSFNNHGNIFYNRFNITSEDNNLSYSGCVGWGYERFLYAILAQKGSEFSNEFYCKLLK
jgi:seryl-tRNA synthetase